MVELGSWLKKRIGELEEGNAVIKLMNRVQSSRVLLDGLTPKKLQAHTLPRRPSLPLLLEGAVDEDVIAEWKKEFFGDEEEQEEEGAAEGEEGEKKEGEEDGEAEGEEGEKKEGEEGEEGETQEGEEGEEGEKEAEAAEEVAAEEEAREEPPPARRRARSLLLSPTEKDARLLRAETEPRSVQEQADEVQVPKKISYWNAGHMKGELLLASKSLQKDDFYLLEYLLRFNYPIRSLSLSRCFMRDEDALNLVRALRSNYVLTDLDVSKTKITDKTADALAEVLSDNYTMRRIDVRLNDISEGAAERLARAFRSTDNLVALNCLPLREFLETPPETVKLTGLELRLPEAIMLRDTLTVPSITSLDLSANSLDHKAIAVVAGITASHPNVERLNLSSNSAGARGVEAIADMLATNRSIVDLKIAENDATAAGGFGVNRLLDVLRRNTTLTALDVSGNDIEEFQEKELQAKVTVNRALTHNPDSFISFLDERYKKDDFAYEADGGYRLTLNLDMKYIDHEKRRRTVPVVTFDDEKGDDYILL